ncbi:peptidoglycan/LPS O-acetylase OafA/YrhL [Haloferula luteola]|uniref:Peptidoglycan/LPS O-acetylase OafA/YrhL n=1 Tax=Haloferula luteola TaxID=595692 RepID=A0A840V4C5_9BACT|nr:acyltransferase [Haloferula luteola]MBB5352865.1 peptidoglycan/LPS O-acetylase OafA/YrhL [Haloferula luteola]
MSPISSSTVAAQAPKRFAYVDELRGFAVLLVAFVHIGFYFDEDMGITHISRYGQYGVQLFFMLSAFTLCHSMDRLPRMGQGDYQAFFIKRWFRIAPLYFCALVFYTLYSLASHQLFGKTPWTEPSAFSLGGFLTNLTFTHGLWPPAVNQVVPGGWSIGCEFLFYSLFPFLFFATRNRPWLLGCLIAVCIPMASALPKVLSTLGWLEPPGNDSFAYFSVINQLPCFLMGMIYFHFKDQKVFRFLGIGMMAPLGVLLAVLHPQSFGWNFTPLVAGMLFVGFALLIEVLPRFQILARIGECSFSIYLVHFFITWNLGVLFLRKFPAFLSQPLSALAIYAAVVIISYIVSRWTYQHIELRSIAKGHAVAGSLKEKRKLKMVNLRPE